MANDDYAIQLTRGEILWLGRVLGKMSFPILIPKGSGLDFQKLAGEIGEGKKALLSKGWVNAPAKNRYEVDKLIYFLVDWLSQPGEVTVCNVIFPEGEPVHCAVYQKENHRMLVQFKGEVLEIQLFKEAAALRYRLADIVHGYESPTLAPASRQIPNLQPLELIRLAWRSPEKADEALRVAKFEPPLIQDFIAWTKSIKSAGLITKFDYDKNEEAPQGQSLYLIDDSGTWISELAEQNTAELNLMRKPIETLIQ
jgi:hypothetical protein